MFIISSTGTQFTDERTRKMILAGTDIIRINIARRTMEENRRLIKETQEVINDLHSDTKILIDMPYNKIMLGDFDIKIFAVRENEEFICKSATYTQDCNQFIPIQIQKLGERVRLNQIIIIGDGEVAMQVIEIVDAETIKIKILNNGVLRYMRNINIAFEHNDEMCEKYHKTLEALADLEFHYFSVPYINQNFNDLLKKRINDIIANKGLYIKTIIKIEDMAGVSATPLIFSDPFYKMVVLNRGEIGVNLPYEQMGIIQKEIVTQAHQYKKSIIIGTNILESTVKSYIPARADILDLTNMVMDGVNGIQFSIETGVFARPAYTISTARKIINEIEKHIRNTNQNRITTG